MAGKNETTTVEVKLDTWRSLNQMKQPGDSMDDVIRRATGLPERVDWDAVAEEYDLSTGERNAAEAVYDYVADHGEAQKQEIIDAVRDDYPAGKSGSDSDYWWRAIVADVLVDAGLLERDNRGWVSIV